MYLNFPTEQPMCIKDVLRIVDQTGTLPIDDNGKMSAASLRLKRHDRVDDTVIARLGCKTCGVIALIQGEVYADEWKRKQSKIGKLAVDRRCKK